MLLYRPAAAILAAMPARLVETDGASCWRCSTGFNQSLMRAVLQAGDWPA